MIVRRFLRQATLTRRSHLAIFVLPDEASAFQAYRLLQYHGISPEHLAIVGAGYSSPDRVGLLEPMQIAGRQARISSVLAGTLGTAISLALCLISWLWLHTPVNSTLFLAVPATAIASGFFGAVVGALIGFLGEGNTSSIYRHHLNRGHYLLMMEGPEKLVRWGQEVLAQYSAPKAH